MRDTLLQSVADISFALGLFIGVAIGVGVCWFDDFIRELKRK